MGQLADALGMYQSDLIIAIIIGVIIGVAIMVWANVQRKKSRPDGYEIRTSKVYRWLGLIMIIIGAAFPIIDFLLFVPDYGFEDLWIYVVFSLLFLGGIFFLVRYRNVAIIPHSSYFVYRNFCGREVEVPYSDIRHYDVNIWQSTVIRTDERTFKFGKAFIGIEELTRQIRQYKASYGR